MSFASNDTKNVSVGKGVKGGYLFSAPVGTPLPTRFDTTADDLDEAWVNLGYISEDGMNNPIDNESNPFTDLNGDTIENAASTYTETWVFTLVEQRAASLSEEYGHDNVTDEEGQITAKHNSKSKHYRSYVALLILKDGRRQTSVIPMGQVTSVGEKQYNSSNLVGRELTVTCFPDENGDHVIDYIQSTETEVPFSRFIKAGKPTEFSESDKTLADLVGDNYAVAANGLNITVTGDVYQVDSWSAFEEDDQNKYYPVIHFEAPEKSTLETTTVSGKEKKYTFEAESLDVPIVMDESHKNRDVTIKSEDGSKSAVYKVDASGCNFTTKPE